ncbi:hypothetical protein KJ656_06085 [bacterium]|nr:hypothetical protein [bacterium]
MNKINLKIQIFLIAALIFLTATTSLYSAPKKKLRLISADRLEQITRNGVSVKKLTGNVHFRKGEVDLKCKLAYWFEKQERANFYRNVHVTKKNQILLADTLIYFADKEIIEANGRTSFDDGDISMTARKLKHYVNDDISEARGNVHLKDDERNVAADYIIYYSKDKKAIALKNAVIHDPGRNTSLFADSLVYFNESGNIEATQSPYIVKNDSTGKESFRIKGDVIKGFEDQGHFITIGNVKIWREDFSAFSEEMEYYDSLEIATMIGKPHVLRDGQELTGERMTLHLKDEILQSLFIYENAVASSNSKAYLPYNAADSASVAQRDSIRSYDEITGKIMEIYFKEGETDSISVFGMATSYYNVTEDSIIQGINIASGDTVIMKFQDKRLNHITVIGGTEGKYIPDETNTSVDTTVVYAAERIDYFLDDKTTDLLDQSSIKSADMRLTAGKIFIKWNENLLYAYPMGTPPYDSTSGDLPTLFQKGREPFSGNEMIYNMKTQKGRIVEGRTKEQDGYYYGDNISKVNQTEFYVTNGIYTTCDIPDSPHYYFQSKQMKLIHKDKIIARPIVLYIHDIPLLALPFGIFPNKGGKRHSGWIMPTYGESSNAGGHIRGLGYFWAPSDYYDLRLTTDFFDKRGIIEHYRIRYNKRYTFNGSLSGSYTNEFLSDYHKRQWSLNVNHSHKISPTMRFSANGRFVSSDDLYQKLGISQNTRLNQQLISNATLSKTWPGKPYSMSMTFNQTTNLQAKTLIETAPTSSGKRINYINRSLPNISFSRSSKPIIPLRSGSGASDAKWYNNIYFSVNSKLQNSQDIYYLSSDSLLWEQQDITKNAMTHNISLNSSQKVFKYITLNQSMSIQEGWIVDYDAPKYVSSGVFAIENGKIVTTPVKKFKAKHTGSMSFNAQTKIYGLFPVRIGALRTIRHVLTPQLGFSYRPDFTKEILGWDPGYVQYDTSGNVYDLFRNTLLGSTPSGESKSMTIRVSNIFQAKTRSGDEEKKIDLFTMNFSTSHNFAADSLRWAPISTSIRTQLSKKLALNISASHDFYAYRNGRVNEWNDELYGMPIPRLTNVSASTGFALSGRRFGALKPKDTGTDTTEISEDNLLGDINTDEDISDFLQRRTEGSELWTANLSLRYNLSSSNPAIKQETFWMALNLKVNLGSKWQVGWRVNFDLLDKNIVSQDFQVTRDLHCWQLSFGWTPGGYGKQYYLTINVKSPTLRDLKYEERGGRRTGYGF